MSKRPKGRVPEEIHTTIVSEYERTGVTPPPSVLSEMTGIGPTIVKRALRLLLKKGVLVQPYGPKSGYIPACMSDGQEIRPCIEKLPTYKEFSYL